MNTILTDKHFLLRLTYDNIVCENELIELTTVYMYTKTRVMLYMVKWFKSCDVNVQNK